MRQLEPDEEKETEGGGASWIVLYADMMSLLLVFFVLLLSFSEIDASKYRSLTESMRAAFGAQKVEEMFADPKSKEMLIQETGGTSGDILNELRSIIPQAFPGQLPNENDGEGLLLRIPGRLLFDTGKDELKPDMKPQLRRVAELLKRRPEVTLRVDGHTDNVPIHTERFHSNWELASARALAVIHFLIDECDVPQERLSAASFGESRPLASNDNEEDRERNRRVEFRFMQQTEETAYENSPEDELVTE